MVFILHGSAGAKRGLEEAERYGGLQAEYIAEKEKKTSSESERQLKTSDGGLSASIGF